MLFKINIKSRRASVMVPAIFLLLFLIIAGGTLMRASNLSINLNNSIVFSRQAYLLALSGTDLIADSLCGIQTSDAYTLTDSAARTLTVNGKYSGKMNIGTDDVDFSVTCLQKQVTGNLSQEKYKITTTAATRGVTRTVSRVVNCERQKQSISEGVLGSYSSNELAKYYFRANVTTPARIDGGMRIENATYLLMDNMVVNGNLFVRIHDNASADNKIDLYNVKINGNLYIESTSSSKNIPLDLRNIEITGDVVIFTPLSTIDIVSTGGAKQFNSKNIYIKAMAASAHGIASIKAQNLYLAPPLIIASSSIASGTNVITGTAGNNAVNSMYKPVSVDPNKEVLLTMPATFDPDKILKAADWATLQGSTIDTSGKKTLDYLVDYDVLGIWAIRKINVKGDGTVNFWINQSTTSTMETSILLNVNRINDDKTVVNFIHLNKDATVSIQGEYSPEFNANIIVPNGKIIILNSQLNGISLAKSYDFQVISSAVAWSRCFLNANPTWAPTDGSITGSLPLGTSVISKYTYGKYGS